MAEMKSIDQAQHELDAQLLDLVQIVKLCDAIAGDQKPTWLDVMFGQVLDVDRVARTYMAKVNARP